MCYCPICEADDIKHILNWRTYSICKCKRCELIFTQLMPTNVELTAFYQGFLFREPGKNEIFKLKRHRATELKMLFKFDRNLYVQAPKTFLDYGGGTGIVYGTATDLGFDTYYHDLDEKALSFTTVNFGLHPEKVIKNINECENKFDYIFSDNVIEHVQDPCNFVRNLINHLEDEGKIVIKTPHAGNTETFFNPLLIIKGYFLPALKYNSITDAIKAFRIRFWHCDPPRHLFSFSEKSLHILMEKLNYSGIEYEVLYYKIPWFENTITKFFFNKFSRLKGMQMVGIIVIIVPVTIVESLLQIAKRMLLQMGILSPGGIILRISK